jgi:hypothetical protein
MGWAESPPFFCATAQVGRDVIEYLINKKFDLPPHPLELYIILEDALSKLVVPSRHILVCCCICGKLYPCQCGEHQCHNTAAKDGKGGLLGIHSVFPLVDVTRHVGRKDPISQKKLEKGDA